MMKDQAYGLALWVYEVKTRKSAGCHGLAGRLPLTTPWMKSMQDIFCTALESRSL